jgi:DNA repair ATPase RecN
VKPAERLKTLKKMLDDYPGGRWYRANLHVHSRGNDPAALVDATIKAEISLLAIVDHNTFRFVKLVQDEARKRSDANLVILPGIEITLQEGAHIIAIFDEDFDEDKQKMFLGALKLPLEGSERDAVRDKGCSQVLADISDMKGITLVPHPFSDDIGFLDRARKMPTKMAWLETGNIGLIQITDEKVRYIDFDDSGHWHNRYILASTPEKVVAKTDYSLAPLPPSEAQTPAQIENGAVWLKMGRRSVQGLRQITCEPRTRVSIEKPKQIKSNTILGLTVRGGFFDGLEISFSHDITCIFGENHSGKTAIFDFISFALGRDLQILKASEREDELKTLLRRLDAILKPGGEVDLYFLLNGQPHCFSRTYTPEYGQDANVIGINSFPEAFMLDETDDQLILVNWEDAALKPEIYPQGHVGLLRKSYESQLSLIDDLAGLAGLRNQKETIITQLTINAEELADLYEQKEVVTGRVGALKGLQEHLTDIKKPLQDTDHDQWQRTSSVISSLKSKVQDIKTSIEGMDAQSLLSNWEIQIPSFRKEDIVEVNIVNSLIGITEKYNKAVRLLAAQLFTTLSSLDSETQPLFSKWNEDFAAHKGKLAQQLRRAGFDSPEQLLAEISRIEVEIEQIKSEDIPRSEILGTQIENLSKQRDELLESYYQICDRIQEERESKIETLNEFLKPDITISLEEADIKAYIDLLNEIYKDISSTERKIHRRDEQLRLVAHSISPRELGRALENEGIAELSDGEETTLCALSGITENTQQVLCTLPGFIKSFDKLQVFDPQPIPLIRVKREGMDKFANLTTELSPGEQSAAILAIALTARDVPLIIDQPEDEIGSSYIVNKIVPKMLNAKRDRQVIIISHIANIPVLADAEYLVKVRNDPQESQSRCTVEIEGTFSDLEVCDKVLELEGGERAFKIRQYRYAVPRLTQ